MQPSTGSRRVVGLLRWAPAWLDALPDVTQPAFREASGDGHAILIAIIEELPATQLDVINALYWERITQGMLALRLGVSQQAIGRRHARALASIRRRLNGDHP
jgi:DNA-directed RNA polymerase specialized sigma24 family protein